MSMSSSSYLDREGELLVAEPERQTLLGVPSAYLEQLRRAGVSPEAFKALNRVSPARVYLELALTALSLAAVPVLSAVVPHPVVFVLGFVLSVRNSNCLAQLIHTSDHGGLFRNPRVNVAVGNACAYLLGYTRAGHRLSHLKHHLYLNTEKDPDLVWGRPQQNTRELLRAWVEDLLCVSAVKRLLQYSQTGKGAYSVRPWKRITPGFVAQGMKAMWPVVVVQAGLFAVYAVLVGPAFYLFLYVLPILTLYPAQIRLRSTVEHSFTIGHRVESDADLWVTRSTKAGLIERLVFAPYGINYHFEHHLFPAVPHYRLKELRELLRAAGISIPLAPGYLAFVIGKIRMERGHLAGDSARA